MRSRIFLSCGQNEEEMLIAEQIRTMLTAAPYGFDVYVAKNVQSIFEINSGIIDELKDSDYYLFVNFRRGKPRWWKRVLPGSLFSNQEFAIAYALGFERILVINQKGVRQEGMLPYFGCNTEEFRNGQDCLGVVRRAWDRTEWLSDYTRRLWGDGIRLSHPINYRSGHINLMGQMLYLDIHNGRPDIAALEATARLDRYRSAGSTAWTQSQIRSVLKATGKPAFSHTIFPRSHEAFDLLCLGTSPTAQQQQQIPHVYLNSALDSVPTQPLAITNGLWELEYQFCAIGFPLLTVTIELDWPVVGNPSAKVVRQETA